MTPAQAEFLRMERQTAALEAAAATAGQEAPTAVLRALALAHLVHVATDGSHGTRLHTPALRAVEALTGVPVSGADYEGASVYLHYQGYKSDGTPA